MTKVTHIVSDTDIIWTQVVWVRTQALNHPLKDNFGQERNKNTVVWLHHHAFNILKFNYMYSTEKRALENNNLGSIDNCPFYSLYAQKDRDGKLILL